MWYKKKHKRSIKRRNSDAHCNKSTSAELRTPRSKRISFCANANSVRSICDECAFDLLTVKQICTQYRLIHTPIQVGLVLFRHTCATVWWQTPHHHDGCESDAAAAAAVGESCRCVIVSAALRSLLTLLWVTYRLRRHYRLAYTVCR